MKIVQPFWSYICTDGRTKLIFSQNDDQLRDDEMGGTCSTYGEMRQHVSPNVGICVQVHTALQPRRHTRSFLCVSHFPRGSAKGCGGIASPHHVLFTIHHGLRKSRRKNVHRKNKQLDIWMVSKQTVQMNGNLTVVVILFVSNFWIISEGLEVPNVLIKHSWPLHDDFFFTNFTASPHIRYY
jgi:hypothetical protein